MANRSLAWMIGSLGRSVVSSFKWRFWHPLSHKTIYTARFLMVSDDAPYDMMLGFPFIRGVRLFKWNLSSLLFEAEPQTEGESAAGMFLYDPY